MTETNPLTDLSDMAAMNDSFLTTLPPSFLPNITFMDDQEDLAANEKLEYWKNFLFESRFIIQRILMPIWIILGIFGNSITIVVMTRRHMQTSTNLYLTALAISDVIGLSFMFPLTLKHMRGLSHNDYWFYWHFLPYATWISDAATTTSTWLTVSFTIERYIAVCHPIKGKVFCTHSRAKKIILAVFALCFLLTSTTAHEYVIIPDPRRNETHITMRMSELGKNKDYKLVFYGFTSIFCIILPLLLLAIFNTFLILAVRRSMRERETMTNVPRADNVSSQETRITVMLISVVIFSLLCQMPTGVMLILIIYTHPRPPALRYYTWTTLNNVFNMLTAINASVNFIFYCALSDRYRRTFLKTFCMRWYKKTSPPPSWMATTGYTTCGDGSPRASFRTSRASSVRTSRMSTSRRSSPSPSRSSTSGPSQLQRGASSSSYLRVPPPRTSFGALPPPPEEETFDQIPLNHSPGPAEGATPAQNYRVKPTFPNGEVKLQQGQSPTTDEEGPDNDRLSPDETTMIIRADSEIVPQIEADQPPTPDARLPARLLRWMDGGRGKDKAAPGVDKKGSVLIKYQAPSGEEQTSV